MTYFQRVGQTILQKFFRVGSVSISVLDERNGEAADPETKSFQDLYAANPWAYAGIFAIANAAASVPGRVMRRLGDGSAEEVLDHPFTKLMNNPNPFLTGYDLTELMLIFLETSGESFLVLDDLSESSEPKEKMTLKQAKEIWLIPPQHVKPVPNKRNYLAGYIYNPGTARSEETKLGIGEVIYLKYASPLSMYRGLGSLKPARKSLITDLWAETYKLSLLKSLIGAMFFKTEKGLTSDQRNLMKADLSKIYKGMRIAFLESGLDVAVPQQSMKDMEFSELNRASMQKTLAVLGVPPIMVGMGDEAAYNNSQVQERVFWRNTMIPRLSKIAHTLTNALHRLGEPENLFWEYDTKGVEALRADREASARIATSWHNMGVPLNDCIAAYSDGVLEPVEGGDVGLVGVGLVPLEEAAAGISEKPDPEGTPEDAPAPDEDGDEDVDKSAAGMIEAKGADNKRLDDAHWKRFIAAQEPEFRGLRRELKKVFASQRRKVLSKIAQQLKAPRVELFLLDINEETDITSKKARKFIKSIFEKMGDDTVEAVGAGIDFDINSPRAAKFLKERVFRFSFEITQTTQRRLREKLSAGLNAGLPQAEIVKIVQSEFNFAERYRAARIARTEVGIAGNAGIQEGYVQTGVKAKRWISSRDNEVRDTHKLADGQEVGTLEPFDIGGFLLMQPGDPGGPPEEIINCRCTTRAVREE